MNWLQRGACALLTMLGLASAPASAYEGLQADYQTCTQGAGKVSRESIVAACTRLIDNAAQENELVGFFHALRASSNTDRQQNCADARTAGRLLKGGELQALVKRLSDANQCGGASAAPAGRQCMTANADDEIAEGRVSIGQFQDAAGRPESAYILMLPAATCLAATDPDERVESTTTIHIFGSDDRVHDAIYPLVGRLVQVRGRPAPALTVHHHAPVIMDISAIDAK